MEENLSFPTKKRDFSMGCRRLLLKNPANTSRVKLLLEMFPNAKFVHICRNPYDLYFSMIRFMRTVIPLYCIQIPPPFEEVEELMMKLYVEMHQRYFLDRQLIPDGSLVEIRYEDFIDNPLGEVRKIYEGLNLKNFSANEGVFRRYIAAQREIKTHRYKLTEEVRSKVSSRWGFVFKEFGYEL
ncbi:MAG TPA: sulfotransferase [Candidatus Atribacteria bacterium]|nr:sulfotransferase [Candidatus Atribacteria bacterium]